jgi:hypothetical protein
MRIEGNIKTGTLCLFIIGICVLGALEPMVTFLGAVLGGGALCAIFVKHGSFLGGGVSVLGGIAALLFCGQVGPTVVSTASVVLVGFVLAYFISKNRSFKTTMAAAIITVTALNTAVSLIAAYLTYGTVSPEVILKPVLDMVDATYRPILAGQEGGEAVMVNMKNMLTQSYIGYSVVASILSAYFTFLWGRFILKKIYKVDMSLYDYFDHFRVSMAGGIVFGVSFVLMLFVNDTILKLAFSNFVIMMSPVFLLGGLAVTKFYLSKFGIGPRGRAIAYVIIFTTGLLPFFSLVNGMVAVGMIDSLLNYRKL